MALSCKCQFLQASSAEASTATEGIHSQGKLTLGEETKCFNSNNEPHPRCTFKLNWDIFKSMRNTTIV